MRKVLGNDVKIRRWAVALFLSDKLSFENGLNMFGSRRWPLVIDPKNKINKFVKMIGMSITEGI